MTDTSMRWGIIGPGTIAHRFATQLPSSRTGSLVAVASRDQGRAREFADEFGAERAYGSYEELLADDGVDAVYISTPHPQHLEWTVRAARAGKHVLCEKSMTIDPAFTMAAIEAARESGVALVEAYMYLFNPQLALVEQAIRAGEIGTVQHVDASFAFRIGADADGRLVDPELGGGGIFDVGCYPVSMALFVARAAGHPVTAVPAIVSAAGAVDANGVDDWATATLDLGAGLTAHLTTGVRLNEENRVRIYGSHGVITIPEPWLPDPHAETSITIEPVGAEPRVLTAPAAQPYGLEADALADAAADGTGESSVIPWSDSQLIAAIQQAWRDAIGARYASQLPTAFVPTITGDALAPRNPVMKYAPVEGVPIPVSRLVMGVDNQLTLSHASVMFDDFVERGGNTFDTAFGYGGGKMEPLLGQWITNRGIRDEVVVIAKGAHTPNCNPEALTSQLLESLDRLQIETADLYFMHRDNLDIPVGEFVDVLDEHYRAGRIRAFGGSNWTLERFDEANAYAAANGKKGFSILSNHFGLAEAYDLPWAGCRHATDPASKAWLERTQTPLFPWSSQARGFFARADPNDLSDEELVRCYYGPDNFERLARATSLANELGVAPTAIALAFVLSQPFPTFALFGPRSLRETRTSIDAAAIELTQEQVRWLDLRD